LTADVLFRCVKTDHGGYGISWNDEIDLSELELWLHGVPAKSYAKIRPRDPVLRNSHQGSACSHLQSSAI
jgi:hypothetical protein